MGGGVYRRASLGSSDAPVYSGLSGRHALNAIVIAGLGPAIHVFSAWKGKRGHPGMTKKRAYCALGTGI